MKEVLLDFVKSLEDIIPVIRIAFILIIIFFIFTLFINFLEKRLLKFVKTKKQISNVEIFSKTIKYLFFLFIIIFAIFSYTGSWTSLGITVGIMSAALGLALQKPITGIAGWVMVITKRPFEIGDRIIIGNVKGDVEDVTLSHITLKEIGGTVDCEEYSGRTVLIPNSKLFEQDIINYTSKDDFILGQVTVTVTYESNLDRAMNLALVSAKKFTHGFDYGSKKDPYIRIEFKDSGVDIDVRFFAPARTLQATASKITKEIFDIYRKTKNVSIAYPHIEVILRRKR